MKKYLGLLILAPVLCFHAHSAEEEKDVKEVLRHCIVALSEANFEGAHQGEVNVAIDYLRSVASDLGVVLKPPKKLSSEDLPRHLVVQAKKWSVFSTRDRKPLSVPLQPTTRKLLNKIIMRLNVPHYRNLLSAIISYSLDVLANEIDPEERPNLLASFDEEVKQRKEYRGKNRDAVNPGLPMELHQRLTEGPTKQFGPAKSGRFTCAAIRFVAYRLGIGLED